MNVTDTARLLVWLDTTYDIRLRGADGGAGLFVSRAPAGSGPPRHVHDDADEIFYVVSGEIDFFVAEEITRAYPGDVLRVPRGVEHTFRVTDDGPSDTVVMLTPGGFEGFFEEMAAGAYRVPEDMAAITKIGARYNLRFTGPPL